MFKSDSCNNALYCQIQGPCRSDALLVCGQLHGVTGRAFAEVTRQRPAHVHRDEPRLDVEGHDADVEAHAEDGTLGLNLETPVEACRIALDARYPN